MTTPPRCLRSRCWPRVWCDAFGAARMPVATMRRRHSPDVLVALQRHRLRHGLCSSRSRAEVRALGAVRRVAVDRADITLTFAGRRTQHHLPESFCSRGPVLLVSSSELSVFGQHGGPLVSSALVSFCTRRYCRWRHAGALRTGPSDPWLVFGNRPMHVCQSLHTNPLTECRSAPHTGFDN